MLVVGYRFSAAEKIIIEDTVVYSTIYIYFCSFEVYFSINIYLSKT